MLSSNILVKINPNKKLANCIVSKNIEIISKSHSKINFPIADSIIKKIEWWDQSLTGLNTNNPV